MIVRFELLLALGVAAFYLQDSALLLHYDELVLTQTRRRWRVSLGSALQLGGRHVFLPNPFAPARGIFRGSWFSSSASAAPEYWPGLEHFIAALEPLKTGCQVLWVLLLAALPLLLWRYPNPLALLALLMLVYGCILFMVLQVWRRRNVLELTPRDVAGIGFESLACPPHAINLVRKLCLRRGLRGDPIASSRRVLAEAQVAELRTQLDERLSTAIAFAEESGPRHAQLLASRHRFEELLK